MSAIPGVPDELGRLLSDHGANVTWRRDEGPRTYVRVESDDGELFAWFTRDPAEFAMVDRELAIRAVVGDQGPLRAPPLLAHGPGWRLERWIRSAPMQGDVAVDAAVAAAARLAALDLPEGVSTPRERRRHALVRRGRVAISPLPMRDFFAARSLFEGSKLDRVTSHGDFHPIHLLLADGVMWVIDWDLAGLRPAGFDLMQLWVSLGPEDRPRLFEGALALVGQENELELARMRYAVLVRMIAANFAERHAINRDVAMGNRLLELLPEARAAARL